MWKIRKGSGQVIIVAALGAGVAGCGGGGAAPPTQPGQIATVESDVRIGDPALAYANIEFGRDPKSGTWYMLWIDPNDADAQARTDGAVEARAWQCAVTAGGDLDPPDCRGYSPYISTVHGRPYWGADQTGLFYIGADRDGVLHVVRPTGATQGVVESVPLAAELRRRAIYPTVDADGHPRVAWTQNDSGYGATGPQPQQVSLYVADLITGEQRLVDEQTKPLGRVAPMDSSVTRWFPQSDQILFAQEIDGENRLVRYRWSSDDIYRVDYSTQTRYTDQWPLDAQTHHVFTAIAETADACVFGSVDADTWSGCLETALPSAFDPAASGIAIEDAGPVASPEAFTLHGEQYATYQVQDQSSQNGDYLRGANELWLSPPIYRGGTAQRISAPRDDTVKFDTENVVPDSDGDTVYVFYSRYPEGETPINSELWRITLRF